MLPLKWIETDVLVIGGGVAAIGAAIEASSRGMDVVLVNKGAVGKDGAAVWMAGPGYEAPLYEPDSVDQHARDTIKAGRYLNNQELVYGFLNHVPETVEALSRWGIRFGKEGNRFEQHRTPGHTHPRGLYHVKRGESFGGEYRRALPHRLHLQKNVAVMNDTFAIDLLTSEGEVSGAVSVNMRDGHFYALAAKSTILATGGFTACFEAATSNPTLTGDGHGMAWRAGAEMTGMEFVQFLPAASLWPPRPNIYRTTFPYTLICELHGILYNKQGERFMERYYPVEKDFATRQAMGRAIFKEVREGRGSPHGGVYLSLSHLPRSLVEGFLEEMKDNLFVVGLREAGIDLHRDGIEVGPAAHYTQGGCWINAECETTLPGLLAAGELGSGDKDGADRLPGNSLPFCMAMGPIAGRQAAARASRLKPPRTDRTQAERICRRSLEILEREKGTRPHALKREIRKLMSRFMMFDRKEEELRAGVKKLEQMRNEGLAQLFSSARGLTFNLEWVEALEARNMVDVAEMAFRAALMRTESRGLHERTDHPAEDPLWLRHVLIRRSEDAMTLRTEPVLFSRVAEPS